MNAYHAVAQSDVLYRDQGGEQWVDSVYQSMNWEERIGQLMMVAVAQNPDSLEQAKISSEIQKYAVGGIIFFKGHPTSQLKMTQHFQSISKVPLLVGMDAEWGLRMRLDSTFRFPWNNTLGAVQDNALLYAYGRRMGQQSRRIGVNFNYAPTVDVNTNPENPIIGNRAYSADPEVVRQRASAFIKGMQDEGVLTSIKHFPGHGDTDTDSHLTLPRITSDRARLDSVELYPFKSLLGQSSGVMVAHLDVPALDSSGVPSSMSSKIVKELLRGEWNYQGLVATDALNMKGISAQYTPGEIAVKCLQAGNDILLFPTNVEQTYNAIRDAVLDGSLARSDLERKIRRILKAKYWAGLDVPDSLSTEHLVADLNTPIDHYLHQDMMDKAITTLSNDGVLPYRDVENPVFWVHYGEEAQGFVNELKKYGQIINLAGDSLRAREVLDRIPEGARVLISLHNRNDHPKSSYEIPVNTQAKIVALSKERDCSMVVFSSPYALSGWASAFDRVKAVVVAYQNSSYAHRSAAAVLFGGMDTKGKLPVAVGNKFPVGYGLGMPELQRLSYGYPEQEGLSSEALEGVDSLVNISLERGDMPGAQILIARHGKIVYNKNFGYQTDKKQFPIESEMLYDLASVTKIMATVPLIMKLVDEEKIALDDTLGTLLPYTQGSNKGPLVLREILAHQSGLKAWIPFYLNTQDKKGRNKKKWYRRNPTRKHFIRVADMMFTQPEMRDSIMVAILDSEVDDKKEYRYSDLGYYFMRDIIEAQYRKPLDELVEEHFYKPLGARRITYSPRNTYEKQMLVPSEDDDYWRHQLVQGYVHDMGAALLGGIAGHAGLFSNAEDLAKMGQMYLNFGSYGGREYVSRATMEEFTRCQFCDNDNRRGLGFDKPQLEEEGPTCGCVSYHSFGHSGFTGTYIWMDPDEELMYIFLSNRTFPTAENVGLLENNVRTEIQQVIYDSIRE